MKKQSRRTLFKGLPVSPGIAKGQALLFRADPFDIPYFSVSDREINHEVWRFHQALKKTQKEFLHIKEKICLFQGEHRKIVDIHQMILKDQALIQNTVQNIRQGKINAEWAFHQEVQRLLKAWPQKESEYFRERYNELRHVASRILRNLLGIDLTKKWPLDKSFILVARDLSPTDALQMAKGTVRGFITEAGGASSHTAIIAKALGIPSVCGIEGVIGMIKEGDPLLLDGSKGTVLLHPQSRDYAKYHSLEKESQKTKKRLLKERKLASITLDGRRVRLAANMELLEEIPSIRHHGAEGVGLFRTETLLFKERRLPTEDEQFDSYRETLKKMAPFSSTIRTFDLGGEKGEEAFEGEFEMNPALGLRGIRLSLKEKHILKEQIHALLRASTAGPLKILIPMITNLEEVRRVKRIVSEVQNELKKNKIAFDPKFKLGVMIEVPSAALLAHEIAQEVDFLSIGTNDLIQYTLAIDRTNEEISYLYEPFHPSILRLLHFVCQAGERHQREVSLCGEMAGDPHYLLLLLGLGLSELSMNPLSIPKVKRLVRSMTFKQAQETLKRALQCKTAGEVDQLVKKECAKIDGFPASSVLA